MVDNQTKANIKNANSRKFIAPMALTVFVWIFAMNAMDMLPVDLLPHLDDLCRDGPAIRTTPICVLCPRLTLSTTLEAWPFPFCC